MKYVFFFPDDESGKLNPDNTLAGAFLTLNSISAVNITLPSEVVKHPVEDGLPVTDQMITDNPTYQVTGYVTNFSHKGQNFSFDENDEVMINPIQVKQEDKSGYALTVYAKLRDYWKNKAFFNFYRFDNSNVSSPDQYGDAGTIAIKKCLFNNIQFSHSAEGGDGFQLSISFTEVRVVNVKSTEVNTSDVKALRAAAVIQTKNGVNSDGNGSDTGTTSSDDPAPDGSSTDKKDPNKNSAANRKAMEAKKWDEAAEATKKWRDAQFKANATEAAKHGIN